MKILITGDYYPFNELKDYVKSTNQPNKIFGELLSELDRADISAINIEFPITNYDKSILKVGPALNGDPVTLTPFINTKFNLAYISNNHALDYGVKGLNDTVQNLNNVGLHTFGVGENLNNARKPYRINNNEISISFLNFSENEFNVAKPNKPGANALNLIDNVKDIRKARENSDYVFVIIHAGQDFNHYPPPFLVKQLRFYAEEGASAIICHHSHYISGYEEYHGVPIFYGLGNLIYPKSVDSERNKTIVVKIDIDSSGMNYEVLPFFFSCKDMRLYSAGEGTDYDFTKQISDLNEVIQDTDLLHKKWMTALNKEERYRYLTLISNFPHLFFKVFKKFRLLPVLERMILLRKKSLLYNWNLIRREVHHNALLNIFEEIFDEKDS